MKGRITHRKLYVCLDNPVPDDLPRLTLGKENTSDRNKVQDSVLKTWKDLLSCDINFSS